MNEDRQKVGASIAWMAMGNWVEQAFNVLIFVILARLLGVEAFGLIAMAAAIVVLCEFLVRETLTEYLVASPNEDQSHSDAVFYSLLTFSVALFLVLWLGASVFASLYQQAIVAPLIQYLAASVILVALGAVPASLLRRHMKFRALAIRAIAGVVCGGAVAIWMALNGYGVWALVAQRLVQVGVNTILAWGAVSWRPALTVKLAAVREIFRPRADGPGVSRRTDRARASADGIDWRTPRPDCSWLFLARLASRRDRVFPGLNSDPNGVPIGFRGAVA